MNGWLFFHFLCSVAGGRVVSSIRVVLLKGLNSTDPVYATVEDTVKALKERIEQIHICQKEPACGTGISPARVELIYSMLVYFGYLSVKVCAPLRQNGPHQPSEYWVSWLSPPQKKNPYSDFSYIFFSRISRITATFTAASSFFGASSIFFKSGV